MFSGNAGQAMSEYIILIVVVAMGCAFMWEKLPNVAEEYLQAFYYCISRPYP